MPRPTAAPRVTIARRAADRMAGSAGSPRLLDRSGAARRSSTGVGRAAASRLAAHRRCALAARLLVALLVAGATGCALSPHGPPVDSTTYKASGHNSRVQFLVLHFTGEDLSESVRLLTQQDVSAHYLVSDEVPPRIYRLVDEGSRAWHAGDSRWGAFTMLNASSIGIEIVNPGRVQQADGSMAYAPFPTPQIDLVMALVEDIVQRHRIRPDRVLAHSDIAPQRRQDPGPQFPWHRLAAAGLVAWPDPAQVRVARTAFEAQLPDVSWFQSALARHGFAVPDHGLLDEQTRRVISAFQMKNRPSKHTGEPDAETAAMLQVLTAR
jgi:N-acetylmuramoyl-L-alanine amidase